MLRLARGIKKLLLRLNFLTTIPQNMPFDKVELLPELSSSQMHHKDSLHGHSLIV